MQPDGQPLRGRGAVADALRTLIDSRVELQTEVASIVEAGDIALVSGTLTLSVQNGDAPDGALHAAAAAPSSIYKRGPDGWRIALDAPWGLPQA